VLGKVPADVPPAGGLSPAAVIWPSTHISVRRSVPSGTVDGLKAHFGLRRSHLPPASPLGRLIPFLERYVATGWAGDNAVNEQIDATVKDGIRRAQSRLPQGKDSRENNLIICFCALGAMRSSSHREMPGV